MRVTIGAGLLLLLSGVWALPAAASDTDDASTQIYGAVSGLYELSDGARASGNGVGFEITGGMPLAKYPGYSVELSYYNLMRKRDLDNGDDYQSALMANLVKDFGDHAWDGSWLPHFHPFVIGGLGVVQEDVQGSQRLNPGIDLGGGLRIPIGYLNASVLTEAKAIAQYNHDKTAGDDQSFYADYHLMLGVEIPLGLSFNHAAETPAQPDCELAVVDPISGRKGCEVDSDHDGVPDSKDQCPGTPEGAQVDDKGCQLDNGKDAAKDADGDSAKDSDGDGVPDASDACAGTAAGVQVDATGCAVSQSFALQPVYFDSDSTALTDAAKSLLDGIAQTLKSQPDIRVEIGGHTDSQGSRAFNIELSGKRAEAVRTYLLGKGVEGYRMTLKAYGASQPIAPNDTEAGRAQNRRVEFRIVL